MTIDALKSLAATLARAGAPIIGGAIAGPAGASIAGAVVGALAEALGVEPTPEAVAAKIEADPAAAAPAVALVEREQAGQIAFVMATMAADLARAETAREHWFSWAWRPAGMWMCMGLIVWHFIFVPVAKSTLAPAYPPIPWDQLSWIITTFMTLYMGGNTAIRVAGSIADAISSARLARNA
jgi:hypothetical protein